MNAPSMPFDPVEVLVCGGGPAGIAAAVAAASRGVRTLLVERFGRLGGMSTNGMVHQVPLWTDTPWVAALHARLGADVNDSEFLDLRYADWLTEGGATFLLHAPVYEVRVSADAANGSRANVAGVRVCTPAGPLDIPARCVIDATGDGSVAFLAGAPHDMGRPADGLVQPVTVMFRVSGVRHAETMEANGGRANYRFPEGSWDHVTMAARARGVLPENVGKVRTYPALRKSDRFVNATQVNRIDATCIHDLTRAEIEGRRQVRVVMDFLRRHAPGFSQAYVSGMPAVLGVRESRRFRGMQTLRRADCLAGRCCADAVVTGCRAPIDVHNPDGPGQAEGVSDAYPAGRDPEVRPYDIPYGCLVPATIDGLLLAGRCISGDHDAHASYRWQSLCMGTGAAAGFAAAESIRQGTVPRHVDIGPVQAHLGLRPRRAGTIPT